MNPVTHFLVGWTVANTARLNPRERMLVTVAGVIPDVDGLGIVAEIATRNSAHPLNWWSDYHHVLGHNLGFCLVVTATAAAFAQRRGMTAFLVFISFLLHLVGDLVGARGPDGDQWPIPFLLPFSHAWNLTWPGQWALNAWPNVLLTAMLIALALHRARRHGRSPVEMFSKRLDGIVVNTLRRRFPLKNGTAPGPD